MELKLTRRRFGQLAIASAATAAIANLANKTFAQTPNLVIYGARPEAKSAGKIFVQSLNLTTSEVKDVTTTTLEPGELLTSLTSLADGTLVLAISPARGGKKDGDATRLVFVGGPSAKDPLIVSGLTKQQRLESLVGLKDGSLIGLVIKSNYTPPVRLAEINLNTGELSFTDKVNLTGNERFSNLAVCPNGTIYTIDTGEGGETSLVQLDQAQGKPITRGQMKINDRVWNSGFSDLTCSPAEQLFALGAPRYQAPYNLYTVNSSNGVMELLRPWDVAKITVPPAS
jgi:hypothetical protein